MSYRQQSVFADPSEFATKLNREDRHKLLWIAERLELRTKSKGQQSGCLGQTGLYVLRVLLTFNGPRGCFPSIATLCERTGFCRATVVKAINRLCHCGLLKKTRRLERRQISRISPWTGLLETFITTVQTSNAYGFHMGARRPQEAAGEVSRGFKCPTPQTQLERLLGHSIKISRVYATDTRNPSSEEGAAKCGTT